MIIKEECNGQSAMQRSLKAEKTAFSTTSLMIVLSRPDELTELNTKRNKNSKQST